MPINEILPFATASGANVMPQSDYASMGGRDLGFTSGVAQSRQLNKVWRQSSFVSAALSKCVVDRTGLDVADDGDVDGLAKKMAIAFPVPALLFYGSL
ncbi:hypothetical protein [Pseudochelatococcus contaminans]|uniref:Uncharacterized protein n=1 Tax=Pseudochelatococcus contaminans TaxID=1538103 RepID=A0A7W5Z8E5_9HYPH|nr:hypothetical protein [Pseudochelatococcus contaminans]MBB3811472.1 hypothetical protein [Pseudochelatococcus contaminans]